METVLVTGGTGYVGTRCIVELLKQGYTVRTTVRSLSKEAGMRAAIASEVKADERLSFFKADLTGDAGWDEAVAGCAYVLHPASPLGDETSKDPDALLIPARDGALRVLRAATKAGVKRVVLTSACAAASPSLYSEEGVTDETLWTDPADPKLSPYRKSKTVAELAAWDFMKDYQGLTTLTTILPGAVFGPILSAELTGTARIIGQLLRGRFPAIPRLGFEVVDVRDLADIHIRAMTSEAAAGQRLIAVGDFMWLDDIAQTLRENLGAEAKKVSTRRMPGFVFKFMALFNSGLQAIAPGLGRKNRHTAAKARRLLGWQPRPGAETIVDCARSLIAHQAL
jgi:nucleoside-diphosphate-sugar epimerase